jgi:nucleoside-diphosphate-sugar epimerase
MKALVVGGNGFIGSHLVDALCQRGWQVSVLDAYHRRYDALPENATFIQIEFEPSRRFDAPHVVLDTQKAQRELGWQPQIPLPEGLQMTWEWMRRTLP